MKKVNTVIASRFEEIGVGFQDRAYTIKEAEKRFQYSCEKCKWRGSCETCKISVAHERAIKEIKEGNSYRLLLKEQAKLERQQRKVNFLASKGVLVCEEAQKPTKEDQLRRLESRLVRVKCLSTSTISIRFGKLGDILYYDGATFREATKDAIFYERKKDGTLVSLGRLDIARFKEIN